MVRRKLYLFTTLMFLATRLSRRQFGSTDPLSSGPAKRLSCVAILPSTAPASTCTAGLLALCLRKIIIYCFSNPDWQSGRAKPKKCSHAESVERPRRAIEKERREMLSNGTNQREKKQNRKGPKRDLEETSTKTRQKKTSAKDQK